MNKPAAKQLTGLISSILFFSLLISFVMQVSQNNTLHVKIIDFVQRPLFDDMLSHWPWGKIVYNIDPKEASADSEIKATVIISPKEGAVELARQMNNNPDMHIARIQMSPVMSAVLESSDDAGLHVSPAGSITQPTSLVKNVEWKWILKAIKKGEYSVTLTIYNDVIVDGITTHHSIGAHTDTIIVYVKYSSAFTEFLFNNWQWFASSLTALFGFLFHNWYKKRKNRKKSSKNTNKPKSETPTAKQALKKITPAEKPSHKQHPSNPKTRP